MNKFWDCKTTSNSQYYKRIDYLSDPSTDLIERFKEEIVSYADPSKHNDYVPCPPEITKGHMLFVLGSRVEILIKLDRENHGLLFMDCADI